MDNPGNTSFRVYSGYLLPIAYLCVLTVLAFTAAKIGLSSNFATKAEIGDSETDAAKAIYFEALNPEAYKGLGVVRMRNQDFSGAAENFRKAIDLRGHDFLLWLRLGHAEGALKNYDAAINAYQRALSLAPNYAQPNKYMGLMLLDMGARDEAFVYLSKAAAQRNSLYPEILQLARKQYPGDPEAMERAVDPRTDEARKLTTRYLIKYYFMTNATKELLTGNELTDAEKDEFIRYLIYKENSGVAYQTWRTKSGLVGNAAEDTPIYDGGFESITESDDSGFGWQIEQKLSNIAVSIDSKSAHSGARSLHLKFAGNVEGGSRMISQQILVKPFKKYRLTFAFKSAELLSGGLPVVVVNAATSVESAPIKASGDKWVEMMVDFNTNEESTAMISIQRAGCTTNPCPIFGDLSLDDFSLAELR